MWCGWSFPWVELSTLTSVACSSTLRTWIVVSLAAPIAVQWGIRDNSLIELAAPDETLISPLVRSDDRVGVTESVPSWY